VRVVQPKTRHLSLLNEATIGTGRKRNHIFLLLKVFPGILFYQESAYSFTSRGLELFPQDPDNKNL
jgi:hypothetical protein